MPVWSVPEIWKDEDCWIIGGGHSIPDQFDVPGEIVDKVYNRELGIDAYSPYLSPIHDKHIIGVNNAYMLGVWVDVLFAGDCPWYTIHRMALSGFPGLKVSACPRFVKNSKENREGVKGLMRNPDRFYGITTNKTKLSWNSNSGAAAINLAIHFGAKKIILLGFDMNYGTNKTSHYHDFHGVVKPKTIARHLRGFSQIATDAKELGIEIINASPGSAIDVFPKTSVRELL